MFRVRRNVSCHVGDVDVAAVPCGFGRAIGNKVHVFSFLVAHRGFTVEHLRPSCYCY